MRTLTEDEFRYLERCREVAERAPIEIQEARRDEARNWASWARRWARRHHSQALQEAVRNRITALGYPGLS